MLVICLVGIMGTMRMENKDLSHITKATNMFYSGASSLSSSNYRRSSRNIYMKNVNFRIDQYGQFWGRFL